MFQTNSLAHTIDALNEAIFFNRPLSNQDKKQAADFILGRQYPSGPHAGLFAPTDKDFAEGVFLFTGEKLHTQLGPRNILSAEAARAILLLGLPSSEMETSLERVQSKLLSSCFAADLCVVGECAHSGVGFMRYLAVGGSTEATQRLDAHIRIISQYRDGKGHWKRFPFHYTLLALSEIELPASLAELRYAAPALERSLKRQDGVEERFLLRRQQLLERVMARC